MFVHGFFMNTRHGALHALECPMSAESLPFIFKRPKVFLFWYADYIRVFARVTKWQKLFLFAISGGRSGTVGRCCSRFFSRSINA